MAKEPKNLEKRLFSTVPTKALFMPSITALEWRVLGLIAMHDGMTLLKASQGKRLGAGCIVSNVNLAREAQCSYAALVRAVKQLEEHGLIERQDRRGGHALAAIRVRYETPDNIPSEPVQNDETVTLEMTGGSFQYDENDHSDTLKPPENCGETPPHYSSSKGVLDVAEAKELDSAKQRVVADAGQPGSVFESHIPANFSKLPAPAAIAIIERAFAAVDRKVEAIPTALQRPLTVWLFEIADELGNEPSGQQALRLCEEISVW